MNTNVIKKAVCVLLFLLSPILRADVWTLDPQHTYVLWHVSHLGFSTQAGKWYATGTLDLDKDNPESSKLHVTINLSDMATGLSELDKHLKGKQFFDVAQYPTATFASTKVNLTGEKSAMVTGMLTLHGVSKPVVLDVKLNQSGMNPISNKMTVGFSATTTINRSDFGMTTLLPSIGDEIKIDIEAEANQAKK